RRTLALVTLSIYPLLLVVPLPLGSGMRIALADSFTFTTIDAPGAIETRASGVNGDDLMVGVFGGPHLTGECWDLDFFSGPSLDCQGDPQPPIVQATSGPELDSTFCRVDNSFGNGGYCIYSEGGDQGFLRSLDGNSFTTISVPGAFQTDAVGVNDAGQVVGSFQDATGRHGFFRGADGSFTTIDAAGGIDTAAYGIDPAGQIVGWFGDSGGVHGFLRSTDGSFITIDVPGATGTEAHGINATGQVVGWFQD